MKIIMAVTMCVCAISSSAHAGDDLEQLCAALSGKHDHGQTTLYKGTNVTDVIGAKLGPSWGATFKIGGGDLGTNYWHYTVKNDDPWTYDVAKMAYLTGVKTDICVATSTLDPSIDELVGIRLSESTPSREHA
ncbi:hypothetical protein CGLAMM_01005 [Acetobacteraceae bacterium EV16G]|uniref:Uncharacterized protein n=2 Tax=Sorlinia euscelidii TaxID=3081148 RepID=A0ABU7U4U6_9PROT